MIHPYVTYMLKVTSHTEPLQFHVKLSIARDMLRGKKNNRIRLRVDPDVKIIIICSESS